MTKAAIAAVAALIGTAGAAGAPDSTWDAARRAMVGEVERHVAASGLAARGRQVAPEVLAALRQVPRHLFVPPSQRAYAYEDTPLRIGHEQTISQPTIVAVMTDAVRPRPDHVVLEVGTGSGYQAAVLARLVRQVYSIEIVAPLARDAALRLRRLGYRNVTVRHGDGYAGWAEHAPFDSIVVTAGAPHVPQPLVDQLKRGGRMILPLDRIDGGQDLVLIVKQADGSIRRRSLGQVRFVPLTRAEDHRRR